MGCHTWFYRKVKPKPTYDEIKAQVLDDFIGGNIKTAKRIISREIDPDLLDAYPEWTVEYGQKRLAIFERMKRIVEANLCKVAVCNKYEHNRISQTIYFNNEFYVCDDTMPHNVFRIYGYPTVKLTSLAETLAYIDAADKDKLSVYDYTESQLKEFWRKYPDGFIRFG